MHVTLAIDVRFFRNYIVYKHDHEARPKNLTQLSKWCDFPFHGLQVLKLLFSRIKVNSNIVSLSPVVRNNKIQLYIKKQVFNEL
jgi:hypothetical protein